MKKPLKPTAKETSALERYLQSRNQLSMDKGAEFVMLELPNASLKRKLEPEGGPPQKQAKVDSGESIDK